ncbi:hypothetical protein SASPL_109550 [Salvia splendens]|uniref:anthocyanidin 3-O-glucoside 5-O-glucosyltransferase n=1 Tax=Salvia splendens TaxID=180675 RepID=A0A8X9A8H2_SALSN|nr:hypothetical protein SASPL_109550 [Salvia splendens]
MKHHHYLITCFPIQGHINPTLQLAKTLATLGATVTFATSASGLKRVHDRLPSPDGLTYAPFSDENTPASDTTTYMTNIRRCGTENLIKILRNSLDTGWTRLVVTWIMRRRIIFNGWTRSKRLDSVVYIAFGSLVVLSNEQKVEILQGLVESKRPFLWVVRSLDSEEDEVKNMFEEEIRNCDGMIVTWCSQTEVLGHKSIGCFVTHCGWNSTLEALVSGVPLIGCPHYSDQTTNAKLVEEVWGNGVRARMNGEVVMKREELGKCLDVVMGEGERGKEIRKRAWLLRGMAMDAVKDGGSTYNNLRKVMDTF